MSIINRIKFFFAKSKTKEAYLRLYGIWYHKAEVWHNGIKGTFLDGKIVNIEKV
jgi:hypothetical protein